jgi:hypothetical protein
MKMMIQYDDDDLVGSYLNKEKKNHFLIKKEDLDKLNNFYFKLRVKYDFLRHWAIGRGFLIFKKSEQKITAFKK